MSPNEWETDATSDEVAVVVIDGCWPLPSRGARSPRRRTAMWLLRRATEVRLTLMR